MLLIHFYFTLILCSASYENVIVDRKGLNDYRIEFITDIEGDWEYFENLINASEIITIVNRNDDIELEFIKYQEISENVKLKDYFVCGGDNDDRKYNDTKIVNMLVSFKKRYPKNVFFLLGNRDVNKLRFYTELPSKNKPNEKLTCEQVIKPIFWIEKQNLFDGQFIQSPVSGNQDIKCEFVKCDGYNSILHLKWILSKTMGAPKAFEFRRNELKSILNKDINDEEVYNSFYNSVIPNLEQNVVRETKSNAIFNENNNNIFEYIRLSEIMILIDDNLFVHGGLHVDNFGITPNKFPKYDNNIHQWIKSLADWKKEQIEYYQNAPGGPTEGFFDSLTEFSLPSYGVEYTHIAADGTGNEANYPTVICNTYVNLISDAKETKNFDLIKLKTNYEYESYFARQKLSQVRAVISGHKPILDAPTPFTLGNGLIILAADTGRSKTGSSDDTRGGAYSNVYITKNQIKVNGVTTNDAKLNPHFDGKHEKYEYILEKKQTDKSVTPFELTDKPIIGRIYKDNSLILYKINDKFVGLKLKDRRPVTVLHQIDSTTTTTTSEPNPTLRKLMDDNEIY